MRIYLFFYQYSDYSQKYASWNLIYPKSIVKWVNYQYAISINAIFLGLPSGGAAEREEKNIIASLNEQIIKLQEQNSSLASKNNQILATLDKKKKEISQLSRTNSTLKRGKEKISNGEVDILPGPNPMAFNNSQKQPSDPILNDSNLLEVAKKYKAR